VHTKGRHARVTALMMCRRRPGLRWSRGAASSYRRPR
jgi:hypothetical protein